ncbi:protein of unknown function [Pseudomonas mediterranea]
MMGSRRNSYGIKCVLGGFTKFSDGACDLAPLSGLTKTKWKPGLEWSG